MIRLNILILNDNSVVSVAGFATATSRVRVCNPNGASGPRALGNREGTQLLVESALGPHIGGQPTWTWKLSVRKREYHRRAWVFSSEAICGAAQRLLRDARSQTRLGRQAAEPRDVKDSLDGR